MHTLDDLLGPQLARVCETLGRSRLARTFYLAGGTALAVQLRHRRSLDLDLFTTRPVQRVAVGIVAAEINRCFTPDRVEQVQRQADQITWRLDGVRVTFLAYPFPLLHELTPGERLNPHLHGLALVRGPLRRHEVESFLRAAVLEFARRQTAPEGHRAPGEAHRG